MALVLRNIWNFYDDYFKKYSDHRVDHLPLIGSPLPVIGLVAAYLYFVYSLGPKFMADRKPFNLNSIINIYNLVQVITNLTNATIGLRYLFQIPNLDLFCMLPPWNDTSEYQRIITWCCYVYFLLKILDLLDTVK